MVIAVPMDPQERLSIAVALRQDLGIRDQLATVTKTAPVNGQASHLEVEAVFDSLTEEWRAKINEYLLFIGMFKRHELFRTLTPGEIQRIIHLTHKEFFPVGKTVFQERTEGRALYIVVSGAVKVSKTSTVTPPGGGVPRTHEETIALLREGEVFGEMALLDDYARAATATAHRDTILLRLGNTGFRNLLEVDLSLACKIYKIFTRILCRRLRDADQRIADTFVTTGTPLYQP